MFDYCECTMLQYYNIKCGVCIHSTHLKESRVSTYNTATQNNNMLILLNNK